MRKLFGIFAHPDDEAFGPSGTLLKAAQEGTEVHLLCLTAGENGMNIDNHSHLKEVRLHEWQKAGELIGATSQQYFGFEDGTLNNNLFHTIASAIEAHIMTILTKEQQEGTEVSFLTFEPSGISGHIDHIVASMVASYIFYRLKEMPPTGVVMKELHFFCLPESALPSPNTSYVFMPKGRTTEEIALTVDVSDALEEKLAIMRAHHSQRSDAEMIINSFSESLTRENFLLG
ncbi:hypothetical protein CYG49_04005 [Candidatus Saccharibacteria bacterium]|nr:MAG: hypothetical protein CYG49_04005 [Candidatus Saccharibacteria bacterium]